MFRALLAAAALAVSTGLPAVAQTAAVASPTATETVQRPRIGLVLSGGGARGLAHVGVLIPTRVQ